MREKVALRSFTLCTALTLLMASSAAAQTASSEATEPAVQASPQTASSGPNDNPAAVLELLRKEKVALTFVENPRLDPQARAAMMRSLKEHFPAAHAVRGAEAADVVVAVGFFQEGVPALSESGGKEKAVGSPPESEETKAKRNFRVFVFRPAAPLETVVLYESASVGRGGVSQRTGLDKRRAALELAMKNLGVLAATPAEEKK